VYVLDCRRSLHVLFFSSFLHKKDSMRLLASKQVCGVCCLINRSYVLSFDVWYAKEEWCFREWLLATESCFARARPDSGTEYCQTLAKTLAPTSVESFFAFHY
jgi:hypothetical protein